MQEEGRLGEMRGALVVDDVVELGDSLWLSGDWSGAEAAFERVRMASPDGLLAPVVAWRLGSLLYLQGDRARAEEVLRAVRPTGRGPDADSALVSAWLSAALWRHGRADEAADLAESAWRLAHAVPDQQAIAAAEVARALVLAARGDRVGNLRAYRAAYRAAVAAEDTIQIGRILGNLSSRALEEGDFAAAVESADRAIEVAERHRPILAFCLENKAEALMRQGKLDLARSAAAEAVEAYVAQCSVDVAGPQVLLGEIYRIRGDLVQARLSFERALLSAERGEDAHRVATSCMGLAWVSTADPVLARAYAERALDRATALERAQALNASAWAALITDDPARAADLATEAEQDAQRTDDRPALATALELRGAAAHPPDLVLLRAAADIWNEIGDPIAAARLEVALAAAVGNHSAATTAREVLAGYGASSDVGVAGLLLTTQAPDVLSIATLGRFAVVVGGQSVPAGAWQSRKVRELLKLMVARSGRAISREAAADALWPGDDYHLAGPRLSVLLTRLRTVLDPDRTHPPGYYVDADKTSIALRTEHLRLDIVEFLAAADLGSGLAAQGRTDEAETALLQAERLYVGDFLDDDNDADWAVDCRERARIAAVNCARLLARIAAGQRKDEEAARWLSRLIERDPYDEDAWTAIIAAQLRLRRHGEARHHHATYARRMRELDLPVEPLDRIPDRLP